MKTSHFRNVAMVAFALVFLGCPPPEDTPECHAYGQYVTMRNRMMYADIGTEDVDKHRMRYFLACADSIAAGDPEPPAPDPVIPDPATLMTPDAPDTTDDFTTVLMLGLAASLVVLLFVVRGYLRSSAELKAAKKALDTLEVP